MGRRGRLKIAGENNRDIIIEIIKNEMLGVLGPGA